MYKELNSYFPDGISGDGIFTAIANISWFNGVKPSALDSYFFLLHGEKLASKILDNFTDDNGVITGDKLKSLAVIIHNKYINNWEHEFKTLSVEYNPIENTDFIETYKGRASGSAGGSNTQSGNIENDHTGSVENDHDRYAFNSGASSPVHDTKDTTTYDHEKTKTTYNSVKTELSSSSQGEDSHEIRKHGNIGVTTNADMIKSDIEVWRLNNFYDILCKDICDIIALSIF